MTKMTTTEGILYYPSIEIIDTEWLKATLCVWDKVYRIVPNAYEPKDSEEVKRAVAAGLVENIILTKNDLSVTAAEFEKFCESLLFLPDGLDGEVALHQDKVDARIRPLLQQVASVVDGNGFMKLPAKMAHGYMLFLAETVSRKRDIPKLTDNPDIYAIMAYFAEDANFDSYIYNRSAEQFYLSYIFPAFIPQGVGSYDMDKIINFHSKSSSGRRAFRALLNDFVTRLQDCDDAEYVQQMVAELQINLREAKKSIQGTIQEIKDNADVTTALLSIGLPTAVSTLSWLSPAPGSDPMSLTRIASTFFICAVASMGGLVRANYNKQKGRADSYYLQLQDVSTAEGSMDFKLRHWPRVFDEFMND